MKLLCLGDSLTEGYEIDKSVRWTDLLANKLEIEIFNCGISGDTTAGMLARCTQLLEQYNPTHLLIFGGTNDLFFGLNDELILSNIHAMTRQARYLEVESLIGIPTLSMNLSELNLVEENYSECIRSFRNTLIKYCKKEERLFIDFAINMKHIHFLEDGIHPNELGQDVMMHNVMKSITELLKFDSI